MIEVIVKRNGATEEFSPAKINGWGAWAAKTLGDYVDWPSVVLHTVSVLPSRCTSIELQEQLIKTCLDMNSWSYNRMAGRLYAALINKNIHGKKIPSIKEVHDKLIADGLMVKMDYSEEEYAEIEKIVNHKLDFKSTHFELDHIRKKYAIQNRVIGKEYETQQFVYIRMAMALSEDQPRSRRMTDVAKFYEHFSQKRINAPTPNYVNLGTPLRGYQSCILYTSNDNAASLAVGDHISYMMTVASAGIGSHLNTRSIGDPVRGGVIKHMGKLPYYRSMVASAKANLQAGRGGAVTTHYSSFDPEVEVISQLKNPMSTEDKKIRGMDYSFGSNKFFAKKAAKKEKIFLFNCFNAPDLYAAFYSDNDALFEELYTKYENDDSFVKTYVDARETLITVLNEGYETGRTYLHFPYEMNHHTPFKETIYQSNLCQETILPTAGYDSMLDLYTPDYIGVKTFTTESSEYTLKNSEYICSNDGYVQVYDLKIGDVTEYGTVTNISFTTPQPEVATCSLAGIVVSNIENDEQYEDAAYYSLLMIDKCIHMSDYALPHVGFTSKARMSAGVGILGLAHYLAKKKLPYSSADGKSAIHSLAEKHMYYLIRASLKLSKELGVAPWMHKTKWVEGWLPIDTYNKNVDKVVNSALQYDWEELRKEIVENGGIRNSVVAAMMPCESSSKASGTTNGLYPIRDYTLLKGDNTNITYWAAPDSEKLKQYYELAWDIKTSDLIDVYAIIQKFTDQGISSDLYRKLIGDEVVTTTEMINDYFYMMKMGLKTRYYVNSKTSVGTELNSDDVGCGSGGCSL